MLIASAFAFSLQFAFVLRFAWSFALALALGAPKRWKNEPKTDPKRTKNQALGYVWGQSGQLTVTLGDAAVTLESLLAYEAHFSMLSGSFWSDFGALWNHFAVSWGHFGVSLGHFGITLR